MMLSGVVARAAAATIIVIMGHTDSIMDVLTMIRISVFGCGGSVCSIVLVILAGHSPVQIAKLAAVVLEVAISAAVMLEMEAL